MSKQMNVLLIHSHDTGRYIQPYGYAVPTPNLMKLAEKGTLFRHTYSAAPTCSPSRAGLLTGMSPHSCGMLGLAHMGFKLNNYSRHLVTFMNNLGYQTVLSGVQHEAPQAEPELLGYRHILNEEKGVSGPNDKDYVRAGQAARYIMDNNQQPFFMSVGLFNTHRVRGSGFPPGMHGVNPDYVMPPFPLFDTQENRSDMAGYIASAKAMDECVGIVLDALERSGQAEHTLVIYTTDHGIAFPKMKCHLYDTGIGVSLIMKLPGSTVSPKVIDALVSQIDLFPTLCDLLQAEKPEWLQGKSFLPLLRGETDQLNEHIFSEVTYHVSYEPMRCIRTDRYKLIRFFDDHDRILPGNIDPGPSKSFLLRHGYEQETRMKEMMFDLYLDPIERENRLDDPRYLTISDQLSEQLTRWMEKTGDPLLNGSPLNE